MAVRRRGASDAVISLARERPEMGVVRAARELRRRGVQLSPSGVRSIWARHDMGTTYQRLMLRKREAGKGKSLSEPQRALLERMRVSRRIVGQADAQADSAAKRRREQLLVAAARVLDEKGYEGTSLREICAAAGILAGSLYYHFRSKENGVAPDHLVGTQNLGGGMTRTRKICKYPNEAVYSGTGSTNDEANFSCVVNTQVPADLQAYMQTAARFRQAGAAVPVSTRIDWQLQVLAGVPFGGDYAEQLSGVRDKLFAGKVTAACGQLQGYLNHVSAQAGKEVETLLADSMLGVGRSIRDDLGCKEKPAP